MVYELIVYWGKRQETIDACAEKAFRLISSLSSLDTSWDSWFVRKGRKGTIAVTSIEDIKKHLLKKHQNLVDNEGFEKFGFGFMLSLFNSPDQNCSVMILMDIGISREGHIDNYCGITFYDETIGKQTIISVIKNLIEIFNPDYGNLDKTPSIFDTNKKGWITFTKKQVKALPSSLEAISFGGGYIICSSSENIFEQSNFNIIKRMSI